MKARIFLNWRTSIPGGVLLILSSFLLYRGTIVFSEFTAFLPTILRLLYVKDSFINGK
jgi:hypothetical protein